MKSNAKAVRALGAAVLLIVISGMLVGGCQSAGDGQAQRPSPSPSPPVWAPATLHPVHFSQPNGPNCAAFDSARTELWEHDILVLVNDGPAVMHVTCPRNLLASREITVQLAKNETLQFHPFQPGTYEIKIVPQPCDKDRGPGPSVVVDSGMNGQ